MVKEFLARDGVIVPLAAPVHGPLSLPYVTFSHGHNLANILLELELCFFKVTMSSRV
jgi:hypothetical protein